MSVVKEEPAHWETFKNLRSVRNNFVHAGHASWAGEN